MLSDNLSLYMLVVMLAMAVCMAITPLMIRIAPIIGMVDMPDSRKVHSTAVPRSGGVGIVIGLMVPLMIWMDADQLTLSVLIGCFVLLLFGAWDDAKNISPSLKFLGQFLAVMIIVYYGDVYVLHLPFMGIEELPKYVGQPFAVFAIVGMINALNLSDGLDGLAGGEAMISLVAVAYVAYLYDGAVALLVAASTIGGIFGFLRFNSHPARIFMGDAGSQTLGLVLGVMVVHLSQVVNPGMSPVVALFLLGLPIIDSLIVFYLRARRGDSLVVAAKDHLHHRLLGLGFYHYESVMVIYSVQVVLVSIAVLLPYESDLLLLVMYVSIITVLYSAIIVSEKKSWKVHLQASHEKMFLSDRLFQNKFLSNMPYRIIEGGLSIILLSAALMVEHIPADIGLSSVVMMLLLVPALLSGLFANLVYRLIVYIAVGTSAYLLSTYPPDWLLSDIHLVYVFYVVLMISAFIAARISKAEKFAITPLDYLVIIIAVVVALAPGTDVGANSLGWIAIQMIVLFYSAELLIQNMKNLKSGFTGALLISLLLISLRALL